MTPNSQFTYRELRTRTLMTSQIPMFHDTATTNTPKYRHHSSLYGFTEEQAKLQMRLGNTKNRTVQHYSSELVLDTDNLETAEKVWETLIRYDYYFELWQLNNYKFFLQRSENDEPSEEMCYQDRQFIRDNFGSCSVNNGLDCGIYSSPFHLIRAKNAIHEVTGAKSVLISTHKGSNTVETNDIELRIYEQPLSHNLDVNLSDWQKLQTTLNYATGTAVNKHTCIWQLSKDLSKICSSSTALDLILIYAKSLEYEDSKAERAFRQGFAEGRRC